MPISGFYAGIGVAPTVLGATVLSFTSVRLTFSELMSTTGLLTPANYVITTGATPRTVTAVTPGPGANPSFVDLTLSGPLTAGTNNYNVQAVNVSDVVGNPIGTPDDADFGTGSNAFRVLLAWALNSNTIRVILSLEPRHRSALGDRDVLNRLLWTLEIFAGTATVPVIETVENPLPQPTEVAGIPTAWSVDVRLDRPMVRAATYRITGSVEIRSYDDQAMAISPSNRDDFPGDTLPRSRRSPPAALTRRGVDINYLTFEGRFLIDARGDVGAHAGVDALKKRIIRRMLSTPGSFYHLVDYGVGLRLKELLRNTDREMLRQACKREVEKEDEVRECRVEIVSDYGPNMIVVVLTVSTKLKQSFTMRFEVPAEGPIALAA